MTLCVTELVDEYTDYSLLSVSLCESLYYYWTVYSRIHIKGLTVPVVNDFRRFPVNSQPIHEIDKLSLNFTITIFHSRRDYPENFTEKFCMV